MPGVLTFQQFVGGPDQVKVESTFPSSQRTLQYNFAQDVTGWTFELDHQTIVVDKMAYDRFTSEPNFANSTVIGKFPKVELNTTTYISVVNATAGTVNVTIPAGMYGGPILPDARANIPLTVVGVTWKDASSPQQINTHRWVYIQNWEPDVTPASPTTDANYTVI